MTMVKTLQSICRTNMHNSCPTPPTQWLSRTHPKFKILLLVRISKSLLPVATSSDLLAKVVHWALTLNCQRRACISEKFRLRQRQIVFWMLLTTRTCQPSSNCKQTRATCFPLVKQLALWNHTQALELLLILDQREQETTTNAYFVLSRTTRCSLLT